MLVLIPVAAYILTFLGWGSLYVPESLLRFLQLSLLVSAAGLAYPLRQVLKRAQPLGWGGRIVVFSLVLALWFSSLTPLLMIANVKLDSSAPRKLERVVLAVEPRGDRTCKVQVNNWDDSGDAEPHWLWLECAEPEKVKTGKWKASYDYHRGGLGFAWVSELKLVE